MHIRTMFSEGCLCLCVECVCMCCMSVCPHSIFTESEIQDRAQQSLFLQDLQVVLIDAKLTYPCTCHHHCRVIIQFAEGMIFMALCWSSYLGCHDFCDTRVWLLGPSTDTWSPLFQAPSFSRIVTSLLCDYFYHL